MAGQGMHRWVGVLLGTVVAVTGVTVVVPHDAADADSASVVARGTGYTALGDSFSSGEGAGDYTEDSDTIVNTCHRSARSYPRRLAADQEVSLRRLSFAACSGATTADLYRRFNLDNVTESRQLAMVAPGTGAVTITIGGNDIGFAGIVRDCIWGFDPNFPLEGSPGCRSRKKNTVKRSIQRIGPDGIPAGNQRRILTVLQDIHARSTKATIYVGGYPRLFTIHSDWPRNGCRVGTAHWDPDGANIPIDAYVGKADAAWLNHVADDLNAMLKTSVDRAREAGIDAHFISPTADRDGFSAHGLCSTDGSWINGVQFDGLAHRSSSLHPSHLGQAEYSRLFLEAITTNQPPSITTDVIDVAVDSEFRGRIDIADQRPGTWTLNGSLPPGVSFSDGYLEGSVLEVGQFKMDVTFTDTAGRSDTVTVTLRVQAATPVNDTIIYPSTGMLNVVALRCFADESCLAASQDQQLSLMDADGRWQQPIPAPFVNSRSNISCLKTRWCAIANGEGLWVSRDLKRWQLVQPGSFNTVGCATRTRCLVNGVTDRGDYPRDYVWTGDALTPIADPDARGYLGAVGCSTARLCLGASSEGRLVTFRLSDIDPAQTRVDSTQGSSQYETVFCRDGRLCFVGARDSTVAEWNSRAWTPNILVTPYQRWVTGAGCLAGDSCWVTTEDGRTSFRLGDTPWFTAPPVPDLRGAVQGVECFALDDCVAITLHGMAYRLTGLEWTPAGPGYPVTVPGHPGPGGDGD